MKPWEIWDGPLFGGHPCVIVSNARRVALKAKVLVLKCTSLTPGQPFRVHDLNTTLNGEDGLDRTTLCECDLFYTVEKAELKRRRGEVCFARQQDIARKMIQASVWPAGDSRLQRVMSAIQIELPEQVRQRATQLAEQQSMSLDRLMVVALVEKLAVMFPDDALEARARRGTLQGFQDFMQGVPDVEPPDFDRLPKAPQPGE